MSYYRRCACFAPLLAVFFFSALSSPAQAQQASTAPPAASGATSRTDPAFLAAADEVLAEMSEITGWKLKSPLKKSIRSRQEIHDYVIHQMNDDKDAKERYASARSAEAFGLIPKDFDLDHFMVDLLTEQIAGLYDPEIHEFYIADWISPDDQRMVMSHELTHALQDQSYNIEPRVPMTTPNSPGNPSSKAAPWLACSTTCFATKVSSSRIFQTSILPSSSATLATRPCSKRLRPSSRTP
jgi:hypothetical protein